jgi:hypothetical protein
LCTLAYELQLLLWRKFLASICALLFFILYARVEAAAGRHNDALVQLLGIRLKGLATVGLALASLLLIESHRPPPAITRCRVWSRRRAATLERVLLRKWAISI